MSSEHTFGCVSGQRSREDEVRTHPEWKQHHLRTGNSDGAVILLPWSLSPSPLFLYFLLSLSPPLQSSFLFSLLSSPPKCHSSHFVLCFPSLPIPSLPFPTSQDQSRDLFSFTTPSQPWWKETMRQNQSLLLSGCQASHRPNRLGRETAVLAAHTEGS